MQGRDEREQTEHDLVVEEAARRLRLGEKFNVLTNPGGEKRVGVKGHHPDIVGMSRKNGNARFVVEVETVNSVTNSEVGQWLDFASIGLPFYLLVPYRLVDSARRLCSAFGVVCRFGYWHRNEAGRLSISYKA